MKLHADRPSDLNLFTRYGQGFVVVNQAHFTANVLVMPKQLETEWTPHHFDTLELADFEKLAQLDVQVLLLGTGNRLRFPPFALQAPLMKRGIGLEVMDTAAACRTYNILATEGRKVAAALLLEPEAACA